MNGSLDCYCTCLVLVMLLLNVNDWSSVFLCCKRERFIKSCFWITKVKQKFLYWFYSIFWSGTEIAATKLHFWLVIYTLLISFSSRKYKYILSQLSHATVTCWIIQRENIWLCQELKYWSPSALQYCKQPLCQKKFL